MSDIGKSFGGTVLSESEYLRVESLYLAAIREFAEESGVDGLTVHGLEIYEESPWWGRLREGDFLPLDLMIELVRSIIREDSIWCMMGSVDSFFVHIASDYYIFIGSRYECRDSVARVMESGLRVERFESPFIE